MDQVVRPNAADLELAFGDVRVAYNAVAAVDSLAAHIFHWLVSLTPPGTSAADDSQYRKELADAHGDFALLRDLAKAQKHVELTRHTPQVSRASQVEVKSLGYGEARWDEGRWDSPPQVYVQTNSGSLRAVDALVRNSIALLDGIMLSRGM